MLTREETNNWNIENEHYICNALLEPNYKYNHYFRVLVDDQNKFYAFDQGCLISDVGCDSYRSALRKNVLRTLIEAVNNNEFCAVVKSNDNPDRPYIEIVDKGNMGRIIKRYVYRKIMAKNGNTKYTRELHDIIDDWNQIGTVCNDSTRVNPHQIFISLINDMTFQEITLLAKDPNYSINSEPIFYNGIPLDALYDVERVIYEGMVIGEINHGPFGPLDRETQLNHIAELIAEADQPITKISNKRNDFTQEINQAKAKVLQKKRLDNSSML